MSSKRPIQSNNSISPIQSQQGVASPIQGYSGAWAGLRAEQAQARYTGRIKACLFRRGGGQGMGRGHMSYTTPSPHFTITEQYKTRQVDMAYKGFIRESKSYMSYPRCGRIKFWLAFPRACFRYNYFMVRSKLRNVKIGNLLTTQKQR